MTERFEGYRIVERLRSDPVADLYEAIQEPLGRRVLLKALAASILPSSPFAAVLEREARLLAGLDHPCVLRLLDFARRSDRMWLVLEHVDGWELSHWLERLRTTKGAARVESTPAGGVNVAAATAISLQIAEGLEHAHERGVIHRELHPRHVLVSRRGQIKLTGFSAHLDESPSLLPEAVDLEAARNTAYLAPERILGEPADPRSDFFSLGVILYELITGECPFQEGSDASTAQRVRHDSPPLLSRLVPATPGSLERLVARCLEKLPGDRFQSATELVQALRGILGELSVSDPATSVRRGLAEVKLISADEQPTPTARLARQRERVPGVPLRGLVVAGALMLGGGAVIQWAGSATTENDGHADGGILELVPENAASLRVVASPWAHVFVNGQKVATTPFAEPIPLKPGTHYVRLDHPNAASEHRTLDLAPGEAVLLDVTMNLELPAPKTSLIPPPEDDDSP